MSRKTKKTKRNSTSTSVSAVARSGRKKKPAKKPKQKGKPRQVIGIVRLKNMYDAYAPHVLDDILEPLPGKRGSRRAFQTGFTLPTKEEYEKRRDKLYTKTLADLVADAYNDVETLQQEYQEWYDGMPENLQSSSKAEEVQQAADDLQAITEEGEMVKAIGDLTVVHLPMLKCDSRGDRVCEAADKLEAVANRLSKYLEEETMDDVFRQDVKSHMDSYSGHAEDLRAVSCPGMF